MEFPRQKNVGEETETGESSFRGKHGVVKGSKHSLHSFSKIISIVKNQYKASKEWGF